MINNRTTEMKSLSKLKKAGKLRYWRGTIEIPEIELHAICDEIQAEYDNAVHALNKAAGNWAKADVELREKGDMAMARATDELRKSLDFMRIWISEDAHLGESAISRELEKAEGLRKLDAIEQAVAATLRSNTKPCYATDYTHDHCKYSVNRGWVEDTRFFIPTAKQGGGTLTPEQVREVIERHSAWVIGNNRCFHDGAYEDIADELNAELGSGTCELTETDSYSNANKVVHTLECSECGETRCPHSGRKTVKD